MMAADRGMQDMTQGTARSNTPPSTTDGILRCGLLTALGLLLAAVALYDYRLGQDYAFLRVQCLVAEIVAGVGMAWCWGGAMHYVNGIMAARRRRWHAKLLWLTHQRLLLIGQLIGAAILVLALGALIFDKPIPTSDPSVFYPESTWPPPVAAK